MTAGIGAFAAALRAGATVTELVGAVLAALEAAPDGVLVGRPLWELAMHDADRLDRLGPPGLPLYGVPFAVKDNIDVAGVPTTAACPGFAYVAERDATVVARLRAAGAVPVAKANLDQFATGLVGTRSPYGTPPNVLDPLLVPGGSSSGSAVAVALRLVPFSLGTDTAGSGRVPAALNGIVGLKPTVGRWPTDGIVPAVPRLDCPSVFALTVDDAVAVATVIDARATAVVTPPDGRGGHPPVVGVPAAWPVEIDGAVRRGFAVAVDRLAAAGADLRPVDVVPLLDLGALLYGSALLAERTAAVGDAVVEGLDGLDPVVAAVVARGFDFSAVDAHRAEAELDRRRAAARHALDGVDVMALPTTPHRPTLAGMRADPVGENDRTGLFTTFVNLLRLPAMAVPADAGAAVGVQLLGRPWRDERVHPLARLVSDSPRAGEGVVSGSTVRLF